MADDDLESQLASRTDQLARLGAEADRRLADVARRLDNSATRAALLVSSGAIASGVQIAKGHGALLAVAVAFTLVAATLAIPLLFFRPRREVNVKQLWKDVGSWSPRRLDLEVLNVKLALIEEEETALRKRSTLLLFSLIAFGLAVVFSAAQIVFGG